MYFSVKSVKSISDFQLELGFENGEVRVFDMKPYLDYGVFKELLDKSLFDSVFVSFDSIQWPNGVDLDPEVLYKKSYSISKHESSA